MGSVWHVRGSPQRRHGLPSWRGAAPLVSLRRRRRHSGPPLITTPAGNGGGAAACDHGRRALRQLGGCERRASQALCVPVRHPLRASAGGAGGCETGAAAWPIKTSPPKRGCRVSGSGAWVLVSVCGLRMRGGRACREACSVRTRATAEYGRPGHEVGRLTDRGRSECDGTCVRVCVGLPSV